MRASKPVIYMGVSIITGGVLYDTAAAGGWIKGDGQNHTTSRVPAAAASASDATYTILTYANYNTGEEISVPPCDRQARAAQQTDESVTIAPHIILVPRSTS